MVSWLRAVSMVGVETDNGRLRSALASVRD
jgi:hypothetical protein